MRNLSVTLILQAVLISALTFSCSFSDKNEISDRSELVEQKAEHFFETFADRNDWEKMCSFYREDLEFEDITLQLKLDSLWRFKRFYNWEGERENFRKLTPDQMHLTLYSMIANDSTAVGRGRFNPFFYYDQLIDPSWGMEFTIWLYFDENLKIRKQIDWIEYDPIILKSVIERVEKNGHEAMPEWLDLSR